MSSQMRDPVPKNENERLAALSAYGMLDTPAEQALDRIVRLAASVFDAPTALISLVDSTRQYFKARTGMDCSETAREDSFCAHALGSDALLIVPDASQDPRFADNPLVTGPSGIRFYAGAPLATRAGLTLGTLCIIDSRPRVPLTDIECDTLKDLAAMVMDEFEVRRLEIARRAGWDAFMVAAAASPDAVVCIDANDCLTGWNEAAQGLFAYAANELLGRHIGVLLPSWSREGLSDGLTRTAEGAFCDASDTLTAFNDLAGVRSDGSELQVQLQVTWQTDEAGGGLGLLLRDAAPRRAMEENLYRLGDLDRLTDMANRSSFVARLDALTGEGMRFDLLLLSLDDVQLVQDTWGQALAKRVMRTLALRIARLVDDVHRPATRPSPMQRPFLGRLSRDTFAVLLPGNAEQPVLSGIARRMLAVIQEPVEIEGQFYSGGAGLGIASYPADGANADAMLASADLALYQAKVDGPMTHRFFVHALRDSVVERRILEAELRDALDAGQLELFYQPQVDLATRRILGAEALLRWRHPVRGLLTPADFLDVLETSAIAPLVGERIIETACAQAAQWRAAGFADFQMSVNLFGRQVVSGQLLASVMGPIERHGLPPSAIEIEITETTILRRDDVILEPLRELCKAGVRIAFDDYGTGYASLSLLKNFPLTRLKIDKSFVMNLDSDIQDAAVVQAIIFLSKSFNLRVIAEGVETEAQVKELLDRQCEEAQGFLFGRPVTATAFAAMHLNGIPSTVAAPHSI